MTSVNDMPADIVEAVRQAMISVIEEYPMGHWTDDQVKVVASRAIVASQKIDSVLGAQWQDIATAPKDGRFVDLWHKSGVRYADCRWYKNSIGHTAWHAGSAGRAWNSGDDSNFTHWMSHPAPPKGGAA